MRQLLVIASLFAVSPDVSAQAVLAAQGNVSSSPSMGLQTRVTLDMADVTLEQGIRAIAKQAGLRVVLAGPVLSVDKRVSINAHDVAAEAALRNVITGTGVIMTLHRSGQIMFSKEPGKSAVAQGVITGKVTDARSSKPIAGANISVDGGSGGATTSEDGGYKLSGVQAGVRSVTVRMVGYTKQTRSVSLGEGATMTSDFKLEPSANVLDQVVVTGTVVASELKSVPNAITVITAKQIEERGITHIEQLFRGDVPGLFVQNRGAFSGLEEITMFSRGATALSTSSAGTTATNTIGTGTNPIKTYVDGVELADPRYLSQLNPQSIERIEILSGPQASTIYGSNALNGVMQIFTKRASKARPEITLNLTSGLLQNNFSATLTPVHEADARIGGVEGRLSYNVGGGIDHTGAWTPSKLTTRYTASGGVRSNMGKLVIDGTTRWGLTRNRRRGDILQGNTALYESGFWSAPGVPTGGENQLSTLNGKTVGATITYAPLSWWSHEFGAGYDISSVETARLAQQYGTVTDTLLTFSQTPSSKTSTRYAGTAQIPLASQTQMTLTLGADHWTTQSGRISASPASLTGTLASPVIRRDKPGKNTGGFLQVVAAIHDAVFFTYGLRAEWNPNYGEEAQPNLAPRYGVSYTQEVGQLTAKLRASYGRATRPPAERLKFDSASTNVNDIARFGNHLARFANPDLGPEHQQGGEGGIELYFGSLGSLVVTRYNQTVDALIAPVFGVDSVRSLELGGAGGVGACTPAGDGYCYRRQMQYLNVGSIRNQGWELQSTANLGQLNVRGTYSWTKSRVLGITPKYRALLSTSEDYQVGRSFSYLAEHTWALNMGYSNASTSASMVLNGISQVYLLIADNIWYATSISPRLDRDRLRVGLPSGYRPKGNGYAMADLNIMHRFLPSLEGIIQVQNLGNFYQNDYDVRYAVVGRTSKAGVRIRW